MTRESSIEAYLVKRVKEEGGTCNKVQWIGRSNAPDRLVLLPTKQMTEFSFGAGGFGIGSTPARTIWIEMKNPETIKTFPADAHERAQAREHCRMRDLGQDVRVVGTREQVDELFGL